MSPAGRIGHAVAAPLALVAALSACSSEGGSEAIRSTKDGLAVRCLDVPPAVLSHLAAGAVLGAALQLERGAAVRAKPGVFVIAAQLGGGSANRIGVWTAPALTATSAPLLVADDVSSAVTTWSSVEEFPAYGVPLTSPAIAAARACLHP